MTILKRGLSFKRLIMNANKSALKLKLSMWAWLDLKPVS